MLELLGLGLFAVLVWIIGRTVIGVIFYLVLYSLVARAAYLLLGNSVEFNGPVSFWVSRAIFIFLTLWLGGRLRAWLGRFPILLLLVVALFIYFVSQAALNPPHLFYYQPGRLI